MQTTVSGLLEAKPTGVFTVDADDAVRTAIMRMAEHHVGALPVLRGGELVGVISERDYARKVVLMGRSSADTPVSQIMSSPVVTVSPDKTIEHCMRLFTDRRIRHLPVVRDGALIGMVSIGDCVRALLEAQRQEIDELRRYIST